LWWECGNREDRRGLAISLSLLPPSYLLQQSRILEAATRCYLAAIRELARVRKLQATGPPVRETSPGVYE